MTQQCFCTVYTISTNQNHAEIGCDNTSNIKYACARQDNRRKIKNFMTYFKT